MVVAGLRFDTSASKGGGSRWTTEPRSPARLRRACTPPASSRRSAPPERAAVAAARASRRERALAQEALVAASQRVPIERHAEPGPRGDGQHAVLAARTGRPRSRRPRTSARASGSPRARARPRPRRAGRRPSRCPSPRCGTGTPTSKRAHAAMNSTVRRMPPSSFRLVTIASGAPQRDRLVEVDDVARERGRGVGAKLRELLRRLHGILVVVDVVACRAGGSPRAPSARSSRRSRRASIGARPRSRRAPRAPSRPPRRATRCRPCPRTAPRHAPRSSARSSRATSSGVDSPGQRGPGKAVGEVLRQRHLRTDGAAEQQHERDALGAARGHPRAPSRPRRTRGGHRARRPTACCASRGRSAARPR